MVERLDAPQPTFPLPPPADIPDEAIDKADDAKRIVNGHIQFPRIVHGLTTIRRPASGLPIQRFPQCPPSCWAQPRSQHFITTMVTFGVSRLSGRRGSR